MNILVTCLFFFYLETLKSRGSRKVRTFQKLDRFKLEDFLQFALRAFVEKVNSIAICPCK